MVTKDSLKIVAKHATNVFSEKYYKKGNDTVSTKAFQIGEVIAQLGDSGFQSKLIKIFARLLDAKEEDFRVGSVEIEYPMFAVVVVLSNPNSNNYVLGRAAMVINCHGTREYVAIRNTGDIGNYLPMTLLAIRPATEP